MVRCARGAPQVSGIEAASPGHAAATAVAAAANKEGVHARPSLAERLRLGSLLEDGLSYKESFIVRCYEVGINKTATVETIANLLQVRSRARAGLSFLKSGFVLSGGQICDVLLFIGFGICLESGGVMSGSEFRTLETCGTIVAPLLC